MNHYHSLQGIGRVFPEKTGLPVTGVVDEHIQPVQTLDAFFNLHYFFRSGEFCDDDFNPGMIGFFQILGTLHQFFPSASVENKIKSFLGQTIRKSCSNAAGSSGYKSTWSVI